MERLKTLYVICNSDKVSMVEKIFKANKSNFQYSYYGRGGANSDIINLLGIHSTSRTVIVGIIKESTEARIMKVLAKKLSVENHGTGIAFTIPMDSVIGTFTYRYLANQIGGQQNG